MRTLALILALIATAATAQVCYPGAPMAPSMPGCKNICICDGNGQNCRTVMVCK